MASYVLTVSAGAVSYVGAGADASDVDGLADDGSADGGLAGGNCFHGPVNMIAPSGVVIFGVPT